MDLYRENILDHYQSPRNFGKLENPDASGYYFNEFCGDKVWIDITVEKNKIQKIAFRGEGCAISVASASMLTEKVLGKSIAELKRLSTDDILEMLGITLTPTRLKCALLSLEVLHKALNNFSYG